MSNQINTEIYFNNLIKTETEYQHLKPTFESHDDWVDFINNKL
jgi:hypothetical protein